jgi:Protein kinase domain
VATAWCVLAAPHTAHLPSHSQRLAATRCASGMQLLAAQGRFRATLFKRTLQLTRFNAPQVTKQTVAPFGLVAGKQPLRWTEDGTCIGPTDYADSCRHLVREGIVARELGPDVAVEVHAVVLDGELGAGLLMELADGDLCGLCPASRSSHPSAAGDMAPSTSERLHIAYEAAASLAACHEAGWAHMDIKPGNFLHFRQQDGSARVRLADFGQACRIEQPNGARPHSLCS